VYNEFIFFLHVALQALTLYVAVSLRGVALEVLLCVLLIVANLFVTKVITLFGVTATCSEVFIVGSMYGFAILREQKGVAHARRVIWYSFYALLFFLCTTYFHMHYTTDAPAFLQEAFVGVLQHTPRLFLASLSAYLISERLHLFFQRFFYRYMSVTYARPLSVLCGQSVDSCVFGYVGLYGVLHDLWSVIFVSIFVKCIVVFASAPFVNFIMSHASFKRVDNE